MKIHLLWLLVILWLLAFVAPGRAVSLRLIGRGTIPAALAVGKTRVGGLSGISYNSASKTFWAASDDSTGKGGPPRIYELSLRLSGSVDLRPTVKRVVILRDESGRPFSVADDEGIACTGRGAAWVTSEGRAGKLGAPPWIRMFSLTDGRILRTIPVPGVYLPADLKGEILPIGDIRQISGIISNKSLESCTLSPDSRTLYTANETSLFQEKAPAEGKGGASLFNATQVRISALDGKTGKCLGQKLYVSDEGCFFGSISDLAALDQDGNLLVLERRVIRLKEGTGSCGIRIYQVNFAQTSATDLRPFFSVTDQNVTRLEKTLVYDSKNESIEDLDNIEGMTLVPLPGGRRGLVTVSDDNFNSVQQTQLLLYEYQSP